MGLDSLNFHTGILYTNDKAIGTAELEADSVWTDTAAEPAVFSKIPTLIKSSLSSAIEFELESNINTPVFKELASRPDPNRFYMEYDGVCLEQIRRHKKKRINKKWAKRYGYREVPCTYRIRDALVSDNGDGSIEFRTNIMEIVKRR